MKADAPKRKIFTDAVDLKTGKNSFFITKNWQKYSCIVVENVLS